ncbi:MAG: hypothetical protein HDQ94_06230 [Desulfovibrio sp.]|nr:hypothetical protein [Desulfovibrio sp.]
MFDDWIEMGLVAQAYELDATECVGLAQHISCKYGALSNYKPYDLKKINEYAKKYAIKLLKNNDKNSLFTIYYTAMKAWRNFTIEQAKIDFDPLYTAWNNNTANDSIFTSLWPIARVILITDLSVSKAKAIHFLYNNGYPLQREVKGLTQTFVEDMISKFPSRNHGIQPLTGKPAHELQNVASTGSNKDTKRIQATRRACETIREEIERGEHGFQVKDVYKTNSQYFKKAVEALLDGTKAHRDTLRGEWAKVPKNIKHSGRVPDQ